MTKPTLAFTSYAWRDYMRWQDTDRAIVKKVNRLIDDILRGDPFEGIGKPEPLRHNLRGTWSRRITDEHRLVYLVEGDLVIILGCRYHYEA